MTDSLLFTPVTVRKRVHLRCTIRTDYPAEVLFPLCCDVRKYEWVPDWRVDVGYSESGLTERAAMFRRQLEHPDQAELWTYSVYEAPKRFTAVRIGPTYVCRYKLEVANDSDSSSVMSWHVTMTALNPDGDAWVEAHTQETFERDMKVHTDHMVRYLRTGDSLSSAPNLGGSGDFAPVTDRKRVHLNHTIPMEISSEQLYYNFDHVREYEWVRNWHIDLIYTDTGVASEQTILRHTLPGQGGTDL